MDSGAMVSTICHGFFRTLDTNLYPIDDLLDVTTAGGDKLPYLGCTQLQVGISGKDMSILALVVEDTDYNQKVPVIIGTNVLQYMSMPDGAGATESSTSQTARQYSVKTSSVVKVPPLSQVTLHGMVRGWPAK